jgi:hypothetical protein
MKGASAGYFELTSVRCRRIGDHVGLRNGMTFLYLSYGVVLSVGFWADPLIQNATIDLRKAENMWK